MGLSVNYRKSVILHLEPDTTTRDQARSGWLAAALKVAAAATDLKKTRTLT